MKCFEAISNRLSLWKRKPLTGNSDRHTLLIMSSSSGKRILQLHFPPFLWKVAFVIAGAILFWAGAGTWSVYQNHKLALRSNCLEKEQQLATNKVAEQKKEIEHLNSQLKSIQGQAAYIQKYLGLSSNDAAKGNIGQGGGDVSSSYFPSEPSSFSWVQQSLPSVQDRSLPAKLSNQDIRRLDKDLNQIISSLEKRQHELEHTPSISPIDHQKAWISCGYGMRTSPFTGKKQFHPGIDIAGWKGTPVLATANGTVHVARRWGSMGLTVKINHTSTCMTTYGHLLRVAVKKGQHVKRGEIIGYVGNSGRSTGYHLHYEIKKDGKRINPFLYMADWKNKRTVLAGGKKN
ncbi:MAG: M23 family metallopeptidase [Deltaproteobacteria bacterium]|nr:M23 family metallopeptidase [Deltaproteobacteria bacterium]